MAEEQLTEERQRHNSFVLRIWWEEDEGSSRVWRGWIQHATSGEVAYVQTSRDLWAFIEARTGRLEENEA